MDAFMDMLWEKIVDTVVLVGDGFDNFVALFDFLGPAVLIFLLAFLIVLITKGLTRLIVTKRFVQLEKEYKRLFELRQATAKWEDREKGRRMARNIDQGELNKVYYDYFFEGFMLGLARKILPIFTMLAYVNEYFRADRLAERFGSAYVFEFPSSGGEPVLIGGLMWYLLSLLFIYLTWHIIAKRAAARKLKQTQ